MEDSLKALWNSFAVKGEYMNNLEGTRDAGELGVLVGLLSSQRLCDG